MYFLRMNNQTFSYWTRVTLRNSSTSNLLINRLSFTGVAENHETRRNVPEKRHVYTHPIRITVYNERKNRSTRKIHRAFDSEIEATQSIFHESPEKHADTASEVTEKPPKITIHEHSRRDFFSVRHRGPFAETMKFERRNLARYVLAADNNTRTWTSCHRVAEYRDMGSLRDALTTRRCLRSRSIRCRPLVTIAHG